MRRCRSSRRSNSRCSEERTSAPSARSAPTAGRRRASSGSTRTASALIFNTTNKRAKGRNLRERPDVSVSVWNRDDPYRYFEVEGVAELDEAGANTHIHELSHKYRGKPFHTPFDRVIVRVKPRRIYDYGVDDG